MSMPIIKKPDDPIDREQSINNLIESVALMEAGLSHVINAEGEKIQKVVDPDADYPLTDIINVNNSVEKMINTISKLEMILQSKLEISKELEEARPTAVIRSSYVEATGSTQTVGTSASFVYDDLDVVGTDITVTNNEFIINTPGLYSIEWSVNLASGSPQTIIGIAENAEPVSAITSSATAGNVSSGALIQVEEVPYVITLMNFGAGITVENPITGESTAVSFRIFKFADEAK